MRFIGQPSAGYITGNTDYKLSDGAMLFLAGAVAEDRLGHKHPHRLVPDEFINAPSTKASDPTVEAAKVWLVHK